MLAPGRAADDAAERVAVGRRTAGRCSGSLLSVSADMVTSDRGKTHCGRSIAALLAICWRPAVGEYDIEARPGAAATNAPQVGHGFTSDLMEVYAAGAQVGPER